jgi:hypothetical protein
MDYMYSLRSRGKITGVSGAVNTRGGRSYEHKGGFPRSSATPKSELNFGIKDVPRDGNMDLGLAYRGAWRKKQIPRRVIGHHHRTWSQKKTTTTSSLEKWQSP